MDNIKAMEKANRMPVISPQILKQAPPRIGPKAIGILRVIECSETPMVLLFMGFDFDITLIMAGRDMADQEMKNLEPTMAACQ